MLVKTKFMLFLFLSKCPSSLLLPLAQQDVNSTPNTNNLPVLESSTGTNQVEGKISNTLTVTEIIEQIDVKDGEHQVISNINQVIIDNKNIVTDSSIITEVIQNDSLQGTLNNETNNVLQVPIGNASSVLDNTVNTLNTSTRGASARQKSGGQNKIVMFVNSGRIDSFSINSSVNDGNLPAQEFNLGNNSVGNFNSSKSKLIEDLINSTINNVLSNILQQNYSGIDFKDILFILNSGNISNFLVNFPIFANPENNTSLKDGSKWHLNDSDISNSTAKSATLKPPSNLDPILDIKFRNAVSQDIKSNENDDQPNKLLNDYQNNSSLGSSVTDNDILSLLNDTVGVDILEDKDISSGEAPAFRSLIPQKRRKPEQVPIIVSQNSEPNKDNNLVIRLSPGSEPIKIDLNQIPINNLLGNAMDLIKRFKRSTNVKAQTNYPPKINCKSKQTNDRHTELSCKKSKSLNDDLISKLSKPNRKFFDDLYNVLNPNSSVDLVCPFSVILKIYTYQILEKVAKNDSVVRDIISSFIKGNEDAINLVSYQLFSSPFPVTIRLQLFHGDTKEFMEQLSNIVDATICSLA